MTWERLPVLDEYAEDGDGRRAVLVDDRVIVASELATAILDALPADDAAIADSLTELFGPPPGPVDEAVAAALEELAGLGLVHKTSTKR